MVVKSILREIHYMDLDYKFKNPISIDLIKMYNKSTAEGEIYP